MKLDSVKARVKKVIRLDLEDWERIVEYAKTVDFPSENSLLCHLIMKGIDIPAIPKEDPPENTERNNTLKLFSDPEETKW